jgi:hypothetical protein
MDFFSSFHDTLSLMKRNGFGEKKRRTRSGLLTTELANLVLGARRGSALGEGLRLCTFIQSDVKMKSLRKAGKQEVSKFDSPAFLHSLCSFWIELMCKARVS